MKKPDDRTRGAGLGDTDTKPTPSCPATELPTRKWLEIHRRGIATRWASSIYEELFDLFECQFPEKPNPWRSSVPMRCTLK